MRRVVFGRFRAVPTETSEPAEEAGPPISEEASFPLVSPRRWFEIRWVQNAGALALYLGASLALFGGGWLPDPTHRVVGGTSFDADAFLWFLRWWPHALAQGAYPFVTHADWAPTGISLLWTTSVPVPSLALGPLTVTAGPIFALGVLQLAEPALGAWTTYLLCRRVTGHGPASLAGGWFFGFGSYEALQLLAVHPNLGLVFLVPLAAYLIVRRLEGSLGRVAFMVSLGVVLAVQFGISTEVLATMTIVGLLAGVAGLIASTPEVRVALVKTGALTLGAFGVAAALVSPGLDALARFPRPTKQFASMNGVASPWTRIEAFALPGSAAQFHGGPLGRTGGANPGYLGVIAFVVLVLVAATGRRRRLGCWLLATAILACVLSLGPALRVGSATVWMPWRAFASLPLARFIVSGRIVMFASLPVAVAIALFAARAGPPWARAMRWALVALALLSVAPNLTGQQWSGEAPNPAFFATGEYRQFVHRDEVVVVVAANKGRQMYWQAETDMWFRLAGGYLGATPQGYDRPEFAKRLAAGRVTGADALIRFVAAHEVGAILVAGVGFDQEELVIKRAFGVTPVRIGGVTVYRLRP